MKTVLIYINTSVDICDAEHLKVSADEEAENWFADNDAEGVALNTRS